MTPPVTPDDVDQLLTAYFKRQAPTRFPPMSVPAGERAITPPADRSRLVLAAGVAGLLGLGLAVSEGVHPASRPTEPAAGPSLLNSATADGGKLLRKAGTAPTNR